MNSTLKKINFDDSFERDPNFDKSLKHVISLNTIKNKTISKEKGYEYTKRILKIDGELSYQTMKLFNFGQNIMGS